MENLYDVIIIGGGPAGLSAGIYAARTALKTLIIEKQYVGGQAIISSDIANYPGVVSTDGPELINNMKKQADNFGVEFEYSEIISMNLDSKIKVLKTKDKEFRSKSVIIATGANPRKVGFKGEEEFFGRGVSYCATCDGGFYKGLDVFVIGGGYAAAEESLYLAKIARKVTIFVRKDKFSCPKPMADEVLANSNIDVMFNTEVVEVEGDIKPKYLKYINNKTGEESVYNLKLEDSAFGIFVLAGYIPNSELFKGIVALDDYGYIITDDDLMTDKDGVFAAGDIRVKELRQIVTAVSDGATAAISCEKYLNKLEKF